MVLEHEIPALIDWLPFALVQFVAALAILSIFGLFFGFLRSSVQVGPSEGFYAVAKVCAAAVRDARDFSMRRTWAVARLAIQESVRRRVLVAFGVFLLLLLMAGWFLDVKSDHPARLYLSFVLTSTNYLVLLLSLFLSTFSLPTDIKQRTIYTVVTKPVRPSEIVLGRTIGFAAVGTALLLLMCGVSYVFVVRGLSHQHAVSTDEETATSTASADGVLRGVTTYDAHHRHEFTLDASGQGQTDVVMDHWHPVTRKADGPDAPIVIGSAQGTLQARVPVYGKLRFLDRQGNPGEGVNVGNEWTYRSFIEGGTLAAGIWTFGGLTPDRYPDGLPLELTLRVFRTYKGDIEKGILGMMIVRNVNPGAKVRESTPINFTAKEFATDQQEIPRKLKAVTQDGELREVDLFDDLVTDGKVDIVIQCAERSQYYGMAQGDVYIRARDSSFAWNFVKGYLGIWMQMLLVTSFGVMFSTFLSGPVAWMATLSSLGLGMFSTFIREVASGVVMGGGPIESTVRILTQKNVQTELDLHPIAERIIQGSDTVFLYVLNVLTRFLPDYSEYNLSAYVAYGFNINGDLISAQLLTSFAYFMVVTALGYFCLKTREVAA